MWIGNLSVIVYGVRNTLRDNFIGDLRQLDRGVVGVYRDRYH